MQDSPHRVGIGDDRDEVDLRQLAQQHGDSDRKRKERDEGAWPHAFEAYRLGRRSWEGRDHGLSQAPAARLDCP